MANVTPKPRIIRIAPIRFTGIDLRTECQRRKYHSGIILGGVTNELANVWLFSLPKISGSIDRNI